MTQLGKTICYGNYQLNSHKAWSLLMAWKAKVDLPDRQKQNPHKMSGNKAKIRKEPKIDGNWDESENSAERQSGNWRRGSGQEANLSVVFSPLAVVAAIVVVVVISSKVWPLRVLQFCLQSNWWLSLLSCLSFLCGTLCVMVSVPEIEYNIMIMLMTIVMSCNCSALECATILASSRLRFQLRLGLADWLHLSGQWDLYLFRGK